jgi:hypothetical protein
MFQRVILAIAFMLVLVIPTVDAQLLRFDENVEIKINESSSGHYKVNSTVFFTELLTNTTDVTFVGLDANNRSVIDVDNNEVLCDNLENCTLPQVNTIRNITFTTGVPDMNLSFGPPGTVLFRYAECGPGFENSSAQPQNQTPTFGIDEVCNNGTKSGNIGINLSGITNTGWTLYASNTSILTNLIELNTSLQTVIFDILAGTCAYVWHVANCSFVTQNPGVFIDYQIS